MKKKAEFDIFNEKLNIKNIELFFEDLKNDLKNERRKQKIEKLNKIAKNDLKNERRKQKIEKLNKIEKNE